MKNIPQIIIGLLWGIALCVLVTCDKYRVYELNKDIADKNWYTDSVFVYKFEVTDTTPSYNLLYNIRISLNYPYYNLYVKYALKDASGKICSNDIQEMQLMDAKTGQPYGSGLGDIYENRIFALKKYKFLKKGLYSMSVQQYMRKDPLPEVLSFGILVEKSE